MIEINIEELRIEVTKKVVSYRLAGLTPTKGCLFLCVYNLIEKEAKEVDICSPEISEMIDSLLKPDRERMITALERFKE